MIQFPQFDKPVYLIKEVVYPPYRVYYIARADARDKDEKGHWRVWIYDADKPMPKKRSEMISVRNDDLIYEPDALEIVNARGDKP